MWGLGTYKTEKLLLEPRIMEALVSCLMQGFIFFFADICVLNLYKLFIHIRRWPDHRRFIIVMELQIMFTWIRSQHTVNDFGVKYWVLNPFPNSYFFYCLCFWMCKDAVELWTGREPGDTNTTCTPVFWPLDSVIKGLVGVRARDCQFGLFCMYFVKNN